mgnify:CR=1 FL=1
MTEPPNALPATDVNPTAADESTPPAASAGAVSGSSTTASTAASTGLGLGPISAASTAASTAVGLGPISGVGLDVPGTAVAVGAHPDDVEFWCGATLARWAAAGAVVHVVICTDGSKGTWDPHADTAALAERRAIEARAAAARLGTTGEVVLLGNVDGELVADRATTERVAFHLRRLLADRGCRRLFVEGGGNTVSRFLAQRCLDRLHLAVAPLLIGDGRPGLRFAGADRLADCPRPPCQVYRLGNDLLWDVDLRGPA